MQQPPRSEELLETPQLQASFEDRSTLTAKDRQIKKDLGLRFRGRQSWPMFRSYRPGYVPWYIEADEARFLTYALEQLAELALRLQEDPDAFVPGEDDEYLIRVPVPGKTGHQWRDEIRQVPAPAPSTLRIPMDTEALAYLEQLPKSQKTIEIDYFWTPIQIQESRRFA